MTRALRDSAGLFLTATVALGLLLAFRPVSTDAILRGYVLAAGAIAMSAAVAVVRRALPAGGRSGFDAALRPAGAAERRPPDLERAERGVVLGVAHAYELHAQLLPQLREIARARLALRRGVDLDTPAGRAALGDEAWELLRPDRPPPRERFAPGIDPRRLRDLVETLEHL